ncbi:MAG: metallophosphoesterase [Clostridia bacterium]|nr:metallophosphoesterase [Clostridia bacterium]
MKIIHCADIHLGSKIDNSFPREISARRKEAVRNTFKRLVSYAQSRGVKIILLSGDVFDGDNPFKKDKDFFFSVVANNPDIDFFYLRGNHDLNGERGECQNLKTFSDSWTKYEVGGVTICGIEMTGENCTSLYSTLSLEKSGCNIVMLHGQTATSAGRDKINLSKLKDKNIDYLALGHVHEYKSGALDSRSRGEWAYSGCLEGRGFDETGEKGFIELDIENGKIASRFIPFAENVIYEKPVDITGVKDAYAASLKVKEELALDKKNVYRILLTGEVDYTVDDLVSDVEKYLSNDCLFVRVKDKTRKKIDVRAYDGDTSLKGEFVRTVYASDFSEEDKAKIISYGLKALSGARGIE